MEEGAEVGAILPIEQKALDGWGTRQALRNEWKKEEK
jgi:hypothetical protein